MLNTDLLGKCFNDFTTACAFIETLCNDKHFSLRRESKTTIAQFNKKVGDKQKIVNFPDNNIYSIRWVCKHFGRFKSRVKKISRQRMHYTRGCEFFIYLAWSKQDNCYVIKSCRLQHSHSIEPQTFDLGLYASNR